MKRANSYVEFEKQRSSSLSMSNSLSEGGNWGNWAIWPRPAQPCPVALNGDPAELLVRIKPCDTDCT